MDAHYRSLFSDAYTERMYEGYKRDLSSRLKTEFEFRLAETPTFIPPDLLARITSAAEEIVEQLSRPHNVERMKRAIPARWDTPGMDALPSFTQVDLAIVRAPDGTLEPKLIELQGFPSLSMMQTIQRDCWMDAMATMPGLDRNWSCWFSGLDRESFLKLARRTVVGNHDPNEVILMDLDPPTQKTYPDFAATKLLLGVDAVDPGALIKKGRELWRDRDGKQVRVRRIYNRVVFDELQIKKTVIPFDYREELDVEWAPHPNWYWTWSKYSLPFLDHPAVPKATFLSDLTTIPDESASRYVLKPLFSFAGGGVNVEPTRQDIENVPDAERPFWCLQEKIEYDSALRAADGGGVKVEIRMMFFRPDDEPRPILTQNLVRLSRGKMLGVDFNKNFTWVGSSIGLHAV
ncbi:MAG TPA: hypothetical protein VHL58_09970 [Thermoanaerobaculia bacterium]|nr:hypothetical protein [Thermoanaerobaculia bacterium]